MVDQVLLGVDLGTGSSKAVLVTPAGETLATASVPHRVQMPHPGWFEVDAESTWWGDVVALCRELLPKANGRQIAGVCVSGVGPCLLLTDSAFRPERQAILYGVDTRATQEIDDLTKLLGAEAIVRRCGKALSTQAVGPKLLWVRRNEPHVWSQATRWFTSGSYAVARLTGEYILDHTTASQCDPLYDLEAGDWARDWAERVVGDLALPRLVEPSDVVGVVNTAASEQTGLPLGTPVVAGAVDAWAEACSAGVREPGDMMVMYGSTMFLLQVLAEPIYDSALWTTRGIDAGSYTLAAGMATAGSLMSWLQGLCGGAPFADLVKEARAIPPGSDGLLMLPYFAGERSPLFDPNARGVLAGLTLRHTRGHLFRAAYEAVAFGIRNILDVVEGSGGVEATRLVAVGGGTQGGLWTQIVSDVCGREQSVPRQAIGASYGSALLAARGIGLVAPDTVWAQPAKTVVPDPAQRGVYDEMYELYLSLYPATREIVHRLSRLERSGTPPPPSSEVRPSAEVTRSQQSRPGWSAGRHGGATV
jgi:xylulokinase